MLVYERMAHPVISIAPETSLTDALNLMKSERVRRLPVVKDGQLVGIVSDKDLLNASPSPATSLSMWELSYLLSKLTVDKLMTRDVLTVHEDTPIEEAARIMADNKIGGLPVMRDGHVAGMITETDLFKIFLELMSARQKGVRVTALVPDVPGELARLTHAIASAGGNIIALGTFEGDDTGNTLVTCKITGMELEQVREQITPVIEQIIDIRVC